MRRHLVYSYLHQMNVSPDSDVTSTLISNLIPFQFLDIMWPLLMSYTYYVLPCRADVSGGFSVNFLLYFILLPSGDHRIEVKFFQQHVPGSPKLVQVIDINRITIKNLLPTGLVERSVEFDSEYCFTACVVCQHSFCCAEIKHEACKDSIKYLLCVSHSVQPIFSRVHGHLHLPFHHFNCLHAPLVTSDPVWLPPELKAVIDRFTRRPMDIPIHHVCGLGRLWNPLQLDPSEVCGQG